MTRLRICDKCKETIQKYEPYVACKRVQRNPNNKSLIEYVPMGDLCLKCWETTK